MNFFDEIEGFDEDLINQFPGVGTSSSCANCQPYMRPWGEGGLNACGLFLYNQRNDGVGGLYGARYVFHDGFIGINFKIYEAPGRGSCHIQDYSVSINDIDNRMIKPLSTEVIRSTENMAFNGYFAHGQYWSNIWSFTISLRDEEKILKSLACKCYWDQAACAGPNPLLNFVLLEINDNYYIGTERFIWTIPMWGWGMSNEMIEFIKSYNLINHGVNSIWRFSPHNDCPKLSGVKKNQAINFSNQNQSYLL